MRDAAEKIQELSLWDCLHDGTLDGMHSDLLARTVTLVVDNPFHWQFNNLSPSTRFKIDFIEVVATLALTFAPWPGRRTNLTAVDYELSQAESRKGRLQSVDWDGASRNVGSPVGFLISGASLTRTDETSNLCLQSSVQATGDYYELRIESKDVQFFIGENKLALEEFIEFGELYWEAFARRMRPQDLQKESE